MATIEGLRARRLGEVSAKYAEVLAGGFPATFGENAETLQVARDVDRTNWLTLLGICYEAEALGAGDELIPLPGIRCTSNRTYRTTYSEAAQLIRDLRAWGLVAWANWGRLKDEVNAVEARTRSDAARFLAAIDLDAGWP